MVGLGRTAQGAAMSGSGVAGQGHVWPHRRTQGLHLSGCQNLRWDKDLTVICLGPPFGSHRATNAQSLPTGEG